MLVIQTNVANKREQVWSLELAISNASFLETLLSMHLISSSYCPSLKKRELNFPLLSFKTKQSLQTLQERAAKIGGPEELIHEEKYTQTLVK